ncbi:MULTISPECIES: hypothetical protein [unclassified Spirillospora]|uniref:hypothetical protein n=1 Tax=unclassified Spirillospora TaxID=2642701 RepID=UPI0037227CEC
MRIAEYNDTDPEDDGGSAQPADPLGAFLRGLLTMEPPLAPGGMRVTDTATGTTLLPGCCTGFDEWRDWNKIVEEGYPSVGFGHDPSPLAERLGDTVRLTVDAEQNDSPVIEMPVTGLRRSLTAAEQDLSDFLQSAAVWADRHVPDHAAQVTTALAHALDMPAQATPSKP